jgi:flagellin-like hook-associated protein FlgL
MADITDIDVLVDQIRDISDDLGAVRNHSQNLTSADIKDFDRHVHTKSQIVDFKHEHEISEIVSLSTYVNSSISGLTVPRICDLGDIDKISLSTNTVVISRPGGKNLNI